MHSLGIQGFLERKEENNNLRRLNGRPLRLLMGGSLCTFWSISQSPDKRETSSEGMGWELYKNYLIAKEKFQPDYFLYENNESISSKIQTEIEKTLGVNLLHINSALVSAQTRHRIYGTNIQIRALPTDRNIKVKDILDYDFKKEDLFSEVRFNNKDDTKDNNRLVRVGTIGRGAG